MTNAKKAIALIAALFVAGISYAADESNSNENSGTTSSTIKTDKLKGEKKSDIDNEITNAKLRAESGSKDTYSLSLDLKYNGGSIKDPFSKTRPSIYGSKVADPRTSLGADINGRYRLNKNMSLTAGFGMSVGTPFHGKTAVVNEKTNEEVTYDQVDIQDASLAWSYAAKMWGLQTSSSLTVGLGTSKSSRENKELGSIGASFTGLGTVGDSKLTLGTAFAVGNYFYGRALMPEVDLEYQAGIYPFAEYGLTDSVSLRTVVGVMNFAKFNGIQTNNVLGMVKTRDYQSIGVGISVARDIYMYPNIQFNPVDFDEELTNFAISATINL